MTIQEEESLRQELLFSQSEQALFFDLISRLTTPHIFLEWDDLSDSEKELLVRRYGKPKRVSININLVGRTKGEGCGDNERALPSNSDAGNYIVLEDCLLLYSLYGVRPTVSYGSKLRVVPAGLVIGQNGQVLLPDFFYTPKSQETRDVLVRQMNKDRGGDKRVSIPQLWEEGVLNRRSIDVTVYRSLGSRYAYMDMIDQALLGRAAMESQGIKSSAQLDSDVQASFLVKRQVEKGVEQIVREANSLKIKAAIMTHEAIRISAKELWERMREENFARHISISDINLQEEMIDLAYLAQNNAEIVAVRDPSWRWENPPLVFKISWYENGKRQDLYCYSKELSERIDK